MGDENEDKLLFLKLFGCPGISQQNPGILAARKSHRKIAVTTVAASGLANHSTLCRIFRFAGRKRSLAASYFGVSLKSQEARSDHGPCGPGTDYKNPWIPKIRNRLRKKKKFPFPGWDPKIQKNDRKKCKKWWFLGHFCIFWYFFGDAPRFWTSFS